MANKCMPSLLTAVFISAVMLVPSSDALKCYQCGQYNDGVGSITPCLNYSEPLAHLHLKECPRSSDKFCIKYVSELSVVRDCVAECKEKEVWETRTYCCNEDACNGAVLKFISPIMLILLIVNTILLAYM